MHASLLRLREALSRACALLPAGCVTRGRRAAAVGLDRGRGRQGPLDDRRHERARLALAAVRAGPQSPPLRPRDAPAAPYALDRHASRSCLRLCMIAARARVCSPTLNDRAPGPAGVRVGLSAQVVGQQPDLHLALPPGHGRHAPGAAAHALSSVDQTCSTWCCQHMSWARRMRCE